MIIYNSLSFKLAKDDAAQAAIIRFATTSGEQIAMVMSGEGLEQLARTILTVLEQNPEMRDGSRRNNKKLRTSLDQREREFQ